MPEPNSQDPIVSKSFSTILLISTFLLMVTVAWSLYDEFFGLRPWRGYQRDFTAAYEKYLTKQIALETKTEAAVFNVSRLFEAEIGFGCRAASPCKAADAQLDQQLALLEEQRAAMTPAFQDARGKVVALVYQVEIIPVSDKDGRASKQKGFGRSEGRNSRSGMADRRRRKSKLRNGSTTT